MRQIIKISIFLYIISVFYSCASFKNSPESKNIIKPLSELGAPVEGSLVYALPRSVFTVVIEFERKLDIPGPYSKYAGDLLGLDNVIHNASESWSIKGITVKTHQELDPSEYYVIESNSIFQSNVLTLKNEGFILDINPDFYSSAINNAGAGKSESNQFRSYDLGSDEYYQLQSDTAYKRINIDSTFIKIPYIVEKKKVLPVELLAEKAAKRLMEMRDGKHLILTGEANVFPQSDAAIIEMNRLEKDYTELFTGKTIRETRTFSCQIIPVKEMSGKPVVLFRYSEKTGPVTGNSQGGKPLTIEFIPEQKTKDITIVGNAQPLKGVPVYDKLFYRVPDVVNLKITSGNEILFSSRKLIYQFGQVIQLPANYIIGK
jgi:hypothetical protein